MALADGLAALAGVVLIVWGAAHLAPTHSVAESFGPISLDNRRILVMEWVAEGFTHIFVGGLVLVTAVEGAASSAAETVYGASAVLMLVLAAWTALTGARTPVVWFRVCPVVLSSAAALLVVAALL